MKHNIKNNGKATNRLVSQLAAEKKKTIIAVGLIAVMALMWAKVLRKETPATAEASLMSEETTKGQLNSKLKISFIQLPKVKGRNDILARDFFASDGWQKFISDGGNLTHIEEVGLSKNDHEGLIRRIAEKLKLEAIVSGKNPQAFINDKMLRGGDKLFIKDGANTYECEVVRIEQTKVYVRCGKSKITLKLTENSI